MNKFINNYWPAIIGTVLGLSLAFNIMQRRTINDFANQADTLTVELNHISFERDSLAVAYDSIQTVLNRYMFLVDSLDALVETNHKQIRYLNKKLNNALTEIDNLNPTDIYDSIVEEIDAAVSLVEGEEKYAFNEYQTRDIYKRMVKANYLDSIVIQQNEMVDRLHGQLIGKEDIIGTLRRDNEAKFQLLERLYKDISDATIQLDASEADRQRLEKTLKLWKAGSIGAGAGLVLILLLL